MRKQTVRSGARAGGGATARAGVQHPDGAVRRASGPRPVRPRVQRAALRPAQAPRPAHHGAAVRSGPRLLARPAVPAPPGAAPRQRLRRAAAAVLCAVVSAVIVAALGMLGGAAASWRGDGPRTVTLTVGAEQTVWEVARRAAPAADSSAELAAVAQRIVIDNSLTSVRVRPGQVLVVATG